MITLTLNSPTELQDPSANTIEVSAAQTVTGVGLNPKVFVYHQGADAAYFSCVASLPQMSDLPEDAVTDPEQPFFRLGSMAADSRSAALAKALWLDIQEDVTDLVRNYKAGELLVPGEAVIIE